MDKLFTKVAAHGLIKKDGKYLVTRRADSDDYMPGLWDLPGGTVEFGEAIEDALKREIMEEVALDITPGKIIFVIGYISELDKNRHQFQMIFECQFKNGDVALDPKVHSEYRWIALSELPDLNKIKFLAEYAKSIN